MDHLELCLVVYFVGLIVLMGGYVGYKDHKKETVEGSQCALIMFWPIMIPALLITRMTTFILDKIFRNKKNG